MREEDYREIKKNPQEFTQFIYLSDSKTPRTVTLSGNKAQYKRDDDSEILEQWFAARGFVNVGEGD